MKVEPTSVDRSQNDSRSPRFSWTDRGASTGAFTLIELLVVIGIVAVLVAITLPALGKSRQSAKTARELSAGQQLMLAYSMYADDAKGQLLPGYIPDAWVAQNAAAGTPEFQVFDEAGDRVYGTHARRYPWRIAPYLDTNFAALYKDESLLKKYRALDTEQYHYLVSLSPSFGLNSTFLGGDADRNGFNRTALGLYGQFYAIRLDTIRRPGHLVAFASARGPGLDGDATEGFFRIDPPSIRQRLWSITPTWNDPNEMPSLSGQVSYRHAGKSITTHLDGHCTTLIYDQLDDMTRWADRATRVDWALGQP